MIVLMDFEYSTFRVLLHFCIATFTLSSLIPLIPLSCLEVNMSIS